jgi:hypothetical protein
MRFSRATRLGAYGAASARIRRICRLGAVGEWVLRSVVTRVLGSLLEVGIFLSHRGLSIQVHGQPVLRDPVGS